MRHLFTLITVAIPLILSGIAQGAPSSTPTNKGSIAHIVRTLGMQKDHDGSEAIAKIHQYGRASIPLLIAELKVINPDPDVEPENTWWHEVWCIRALRSLTGQRFEYRTREKLSKRLAAYSGPNDKMGYTMEWMSHGEVFIAPQDVQRKVIASWNEWQKKNGSTFKIQPLNPYGDW